MNLLRGIVALVVGALLVAPVSAKTAKMVTYAATSGGARAPVAAGGSEYCVVAAGDVDPLGSGDAALRAVSFDEVYAAMSEALAARGYVVTDREETALVRIVVHWGRTQPQGALVLTDGVVRSAPTSGAGFKNNTGAVAGLPLEREPDSRKLTAEVLGYGREYTRLRGEAQVVSKEYQLKEMTDELDEDRYFVVAMTYDMPAWRQDGRKVLLWQARFSLGAEGIDPRTQIPAMIEHAGRFFAGQTDGLDRRFVPVR